MPRHSTLSTHVLVRLRAWFGLTQTELALYLGCSQTLIQAIESGQRRLAGSLHAALQPLLQQLPPAGGPLAPEAPPRLPTATATEVDFRRRVCQQQQARLLRELAQLEQQQRLAERWAHALPALLLAATPAPNQPDSDPARTTWVQGWLRRRAQPLPAAAATRYQLLQARLAGLAAELAALAPAN